MLLPIAIMNFQNNLTNITNFVFVFGITPYKFNRKTNKFECSPFSLIYTVVYFVVISIGLVYVSIGYYLKNVTTASILNILKFTTVMTIFNSILINLLLNRQKHAIFLNKLLKAGRNLTELNILLDHGCLLLHRQHIFLVCLSATFYIIDAIFEWNEMDLSGFAWYFLHFFQTSALTLVTYYIRCIATALYQACIGVLKYMDNKIHDDRTKLKIDGLMQCFKAFDELTYLKKQLSSIFGIQLLLSSAFDFIIVTISVYELLYYAKPFQLKNLFYFAVYSLPHIIKCVLLVEALETLADQVG